MYPYPCPFCQQRLLAAPERIGQRTICPKCLKPIVIPQPEGMPEEEEGRISVPELLGEHSATIFNDDDDSIDDSDGMNLSLPGGEEEFQGFVGDSGLPFDALDARLPAATVHEGQLTGQAMALAAAAALPASPHLGGLGAQPVAFGAQDTPRPTTTTPSTLLPPPRKNGVVVFQPEPGSSQDLAAELSTALTLRMKPPPEPPSDLRASTGGWLALTASALSLWMLSMMRSADDSVARQLLLAVSVIGSLEIIISYVWVAYLSGRKTAERGLQALLPPVWIYRLFHPCENTPGYRPLRFATTGLLLILLALLGEQLRPAVQQLTGEPDTQTREIPKPVNSPLTLLKTAGREGLNRPLIDALTDLAKDPAAFHAAPEETTRLLVEIRAYRNHEDGEVRAAALMALKKWGGLAAAKPDVLAVLRNSRAEPHERRAALDAAREYKDREVAVAVAGCLRHRGFYDDTDRVAADSLRAIGPPEAEDALLDLFEDEDLLLRGLPGLLAELGTQKSVTKLREIAAQTQSKDVRIEALKTADKIAARLGK